MEIRHLPLTDGSLFLDCEACFDSATAENASLYLFKPPGATTELAPFVQCLSAAGLWAEGADKAVADAQKAIYARELEVLDVVQLGDAGILAGRYDHPRYRSSEQRWLSWLDCLAQYSG